MLDNKTFHLWAKKRGQRRRIKILVDEDVFLRYQNMHLKVDIYHRVYTTSGVDKKYLAREIFNLTTTRDRVFFKSANKFDMRKSNLLLQPTPEENIGRYAVQYLDSCNINSDCFLR
jgi:hypothetical protein